MLRLGGVTHVRCELGWSLPEQWSLRLEDCDLWYVCAGLGWMRLADGQEVDLQAGVAVWMRPGGRYITRQDPAQRLTVAAVHFTEDQPPPKQEIFRLRDPAFGSAVMKHVVELVRESQLDAATRLMGAFLAELRDGICTQPTGLAGTELHHRQVIDAAVARIRESPGEAPTVAQLADDAGYSVAHFTRLFREHVGMPPREFLVQQRVERAKMLLRDTPLSISQIAASLGYTSVFFFSRQFRQVAGVSPKVYRAKTT